MNNYTIYKCEEKEYVRDPADGRNDVKVWPFRALAKRECENLNKMSGVTYEMRVLTDEEVAKLDSEPVNDSFFTNLAQKAADFEKQMEAGDITLAEYDAKTEDMQDKAAESGGILKHDTDDDKEAFVKECFADEDETIYRLDDDQTYEMIYFDALEKLVHVGGWRAGRLDEWVRHIAGELVEKIKEGNEEQ